MRTQIVSPTSNLDSILFMIGKRWEISLGILTFAGILISMEATRDIGILIGLASILTFYINLKNFLHNNTRKINIRNVKDIPDESELIIDRKDIAEKIVNTIFDTKDDRVSILVGTSGSGKSILIREFFPAQYKNHFKDGTICKQIIIKSYENIKDVIIHEMYDKGFIDDEHIAINDALKKIKNNQRIFFIFDQFESVFMLKHDTAVRQLKVLCELFNSLKVLNEKEKMIYCLIVMRKEWYFNLKFFGDIIPHLKNTFVLEGFNIQDKTLEEDIKTKLYAFTDDDDLTDEIIKDCSQITTSEGFYVTSCEELMHRSEQGKNDQTSIILPVELMTVSESVFIYKRDKASKGVPFFLEDKNKAIRRFFDYYLKSFPEKNDAMQVLYSLSVSPKERRMLSLEEISNITNIPYDRVDKVITYFLGREENGEKSKERKPLLIESIDSKFDWKHDFFAEHCSEISGSMLDPIDRDNINYFWFNRNQKLSDKKAYIPSQNLINPKAHNLSSVLFIISFLCLILRTFYPLLRKIVPFDHFLTKFSVPLFSIPEMNWVTNIDLSFLPISVSLTLWSWYVTTAYRRLFSILQEPPKSFAARYSLFVAWWSLICVLLTIFFPLLWVFFTGVGGLIIGLKYQQMTKSDKSITSTFEETFMKRLYKETKINSVVMMVIGFFYSLLFPPFFYQDYYSSNWYIGIILTTLFFIIMVYFALVISIKEHTHPNKIPSYLGVYNRYRF